MCKVFTEEEKELFDKADAELLKYRSKMFEMKLHPSYYVSIILIECVGIAREYYPKKPEQMPYGISDYKNYMRHCLEEILQRMDDK